MYCLFSTRVKLSYESHAHVPLLFANDLWFTCVPNQTPVLTFKLPLLLYTYNCCFRLIIFGTSQNENCFNDIPIIIQMCCA